MAERRFGGSVNTVQEFIGASSGIFCPVLVTTSEEGQSCLREDNLSDSGPSWTQLRGTVEGKRTLYIRKEMIIYQGI